MAASRSLLCLCGLIGYFPFLSSWLGASGLRATSRLTASDAEILEIYTAIGNKNRS